MPTTLTANYSFQKPGIGEQANTWGGTLNSNFDSIDSHIFTNATTISGHGTSITNLNNQMAATVASQLLNLINVNTAGLASTAAAPYASGLQTQVTAASNLANTANNTANAANSLAGTANATANTANATANAASSASSANTSAIGGLQGIASWGSLRALSTSTGTINADWIILKQAAVNGAAVGFELAFGRGRGQEGDTIPLPAGFTAGASYAEAAASFVNCPNPTSLIVVQLTGLTLSAVHAFSPADGVTSARGKVWASWWCFAWRTGIV